MKQKTFYLILKYGTYMLDWRWQKAKGLMALKPLSPNVLLFMVCPKYHQYQWHQPMPPPFRCDVMWCSVACCITSIWSCLITTDNWLVSRNLSETEAPAKICPASRGRASWRESAFFLYHWTAAQIPLVVYVPLVEKLWPKELIQTNLN